MTQRLTGPALVAYLRANPTSEAMRDAADEIVGLIAQHHRDSKELRRLCAARDEARRERDEYAKRLEAERDRLRDALGNISHAANPENKEAQWRIKAARAALTQQEQGK